MVYHYIFAFFLKYCTFFIRKDKWQVVFSVVNTNNWSGRWLKHMITEALRGHVYTRNIFRVEEIVPARKKSYPREMISSSRKLFLAYTCPFRASVHMGPQHWAPGPPRSVYNTKKEICRK